MGFTVRQSFEMPFLYHTEPDSHVRFAAVLICEIRDETHRAPLLAVFPGAIQRSVHVCAVTVTLCEYHIGTDIERPLRPAVDPDTPSRVAVLLSCQRAELRRLARSCMHGSIIAENDGSDSIRSHCAVDASTSETSFTGPDERHTLPIFYLNQPPGARNNAALSSQSGVRYDSDFS